MYIDSFDDRKNRMNIFITYFRIFQFIQFASLQFKKLITLYDISHTFIILPSLNFLEAID